MQKSKVAVWGDLTNICEKKRREKHRKSMQFLSFIEPIFAWNVPLVSLNFLEEISSLSHSVVFLYFLALITEEGFLISTCYTLELCIQMFIFPFLLCFSLLFFSQLFVRAPQRAILLFYISFPWGWSWSLSPVQCHKPPSMVHQALYQIYSFNLISHIHCIIIRGLI